MSLILHYIESNGSSVALVEEISFTGMAANAEESNITDTEVI